MTDTLKCPCYAGFERSVPTYHLIIQPSEVAFACLII